MDREIPREEIRRCRIRTIITRSAIAGVAVIAILVLIFSMRKGVKLSLIHI